jgi:hypothetical protein
MVEEQKPTIYKAVAAGLGSLLTFLIGVIGPGEGFDAVSLNEWLVGAVAVLGTVAAVYQLPFTKSA